MDLQKTIENVTEQLNKRMAQFDAELAVVREKSGTPYTLDTLVAEFKSFRSDTKDILTNLQSIVSMIVRDVDKLEMRSRRKILLLHGVPEHDGENAAETVVSVFADHFEDSSIELNNIGRCHRMGRLDGEKPRPLLVKFRDVADRDRIWFGKKSLKNSGQTLSEFLTASRHRLFMAARKKLGVSKCWTRDGDIYCIASDGKKRRITSSAELDDIADTNTTNITSVHSEKASEMPSVQTSQQAAPSTRRRAATANKK